jgi:hypothetical protein
VFEDPKEGEHRAINSKLFTDWVTEVFSKEKGYCQLLLEELLIWYAKHQTTPRNVAANPSNRLQDLSRLVPGCIITLDDWELESDDDEDDDAGCVAGGAGRAAGDDGGLGS